MTEKMLLLAVWRGDCAVLDERNTQIKITELETPNGILRVHGDGCTVGIEQHLSITYRDVMTLTSVPSTFTYGQVRDWLLDIANNIDANLKQDDVGELLRSLEEAEL